MRVRPESSSPQTYLNQTTGNDPLNYGLTSDAGALDYKDSVDILGVSMHELEDFINPNTPSKAHQISGDPC